jgi:hypothetical protein
MTVIDLKSHPFQRKIFGKTMWGIQMFAGRLIFKQVMDFIPLQEGDNLSYYSQKVHTITKLQLVIVITNDVLCGNISLISLLMTSLKNTI